MQVLSVIVVIILQIAVLLHGQAENSEYHIVQPGEHPFVVSLGVSTTHRKCIGSLINQNWVLTSATCGHKGEPLLVQHGAIQNQVPTGQLVIVSDVIPHPKYTGTVDNCMNLIRLRDPVKYDGYTQAVKLVPKRKGVPINSTAFAVSWSPEEILQEYKNNIIERQFSQLFATTANLTLGYKNVGTPLIYDGYQIGILVYSKNDILHYTDISLHLDWIYRTVNYYEFKEEYFYLRNLEPNCSATQDANDVLNICCTYPFGYQLLDLCIEFI